ncbi:MULTISPECIES: DUF5326 family protein [Streptomyces]|uniref:DUF5326 family protein n=2 Tax=Streptomyces TaxID=1883 RepID=A0ABX1CFM8_9ACTN|nr:MULTISPECIES: DUF5326 family protein [Streptomyces]NJP68424.1 DUF5326 family protein [Streptomyces spiramenti]NJQ16227.1 DUF5326 family protein [Streptomyces bohaiensis]
MKDAFMTLPWWVRWIAIPVVALVIFGGMIASVLTWVIGLLFKILLFVAVVALLIYLVRRFSGSSKSAGDW